MTQNATIQPDVGAGRRNGDAELILLVEDSRTQALRTQIILEEAGWRVAVCADGAAAIAQASSMTPDLILLDIHLPGMNGREVARRLKADPILSVMPIIFLTSVFGEFEDIVRGLNQGADDYLLKSVRDEELVARVRATLRASRTQRDLARLARLLLSVNQVGNQLAGILDLPRLLDSACRLLSDVIAGASVNVYLVTGRELVLSAAAGPHAEALLAEPPRLPLDGDSLVAECVRAVRMLHLSLPVADPRSHLRIAEVRSWVALALPASGEVVGALEVASASMLVLDHTETLVVSTIADLLGVGVHNLRLFRKMEVLAMTDGLTGLMNRRAMMKHLEGEWSRSNRHQRPLALISIDIDHFKQINDRHGHAAGDDAIKAVGEMICDAIRKEDFAGRLGGDEFLLILPDIDRSGALGLAARIRNASARIKIEAGAPGTPITLTLSLGVASWPETNVLTFDELLQISDQALYRAKSAGRDGASA